VTGMIKGIDKSFTGFGFQGVFMQVRWQKMG
jgi:hypothetical protein